MSEKMVKAEKTRWVNKFNDEEIENDIKLKVAERNKIIEEHRILEKEREEERCRVNELKILARLKEKYENQ